jgi:hypothetical protein
MNSLQDELVRKGLAKSTLLKQPPPQIKLPATAAQEKKDLQDHDIKTSRKADSGKFAFATCRAGRVKTPGYNPPPKGAAGPVKKFTMLDILKTHNQDIYYEFSNKIHGMENKTSVNVFLLTLKLGRPVSAGDIHQVITELAGLKCVLKNVYMKVKQLRLTELSRYLRQDNRGLRKEYTLNPEGQKLHLDELFRLFKTPLKAEGPEPEPQPEVVATPPAPPAPAPTLTPKIVPRVAKARKRGIVPRDIRLTIKFDLSDLIQLIGR